jgi:DivIVA domain-containing protein
VPFTPEEIDSKEFLITLRGYDKDEVKAFLKAVAADYRAALSSADSGQDAPTSAYEALGKDIGQVLQVAKQSADQLKRKAEEDATSMRRRAEEEAANLRDAASSAARRLTEEAERHAVQVRAEAEREATEKTASATRRVEKLQSAESKLRQRLYALEMMLQSMRQELESDDGGDGGDAEGDGLNATSQGGLLGDSGTERPAPPGRGGDSALGGLDDDLAIDAPLDDSDRDEESPSRPPTA